MTVQELLRKYGFGSWTKPEEVWRGRNISRVSVIITTIFLNEMTICNQRGRGKLCPFVSKSSHQVIQKLSQSCLRVVSYYSKISQRCLKVCQSCVIVLPKLCRRCVQVVTKLYLSCIQVVSKLCPSCC